MRRKLFVVLCALAMSAGALHSSGAQGNTVNPSDSVIKEADVRRILSTLAADSMEGRKAGTRGGEKAAAFVATEMKSIGLVPVDSNGYFQVVPKLGSNVLGVLRGS